MKLIKSFLAVSFAVLVSACNKDKIRGSGDVISEVRNVTGFTGVVVNGSTKAFINIGTAFTVSVKGYQTLLPFLETNIKNSILEVAFSNNVTVNNDNTEIYITLPLLDYVQTNGIGDMTITGEVTGSGHLKASVNGSARISVEKGSADEFDGAISGNGKILALGFQCKEANVNISGDGDIEIAVSDRLAVIISGNGKVYYRGTPVITTDISGSGQVIPK